MRPLGKLPPSITNDASALSDYSDRVIRASAAPDCYLDTASAHRDRRISSLEFFKRVVRHLGPKDARVRHPDDDRPLGDFINPLFYKGEFGPVAVAVKLCESDPLAATVDIDQLVLLLSECTSTTRSIETVKEQDASFDTPIMGSSLFRQALFVAALQSKNISLAINLIQHSPLDPPPPDHCVFKIWCSPLINDREMPAAVHAAVVAAGWEEPSDELVFIAGASHDPEGGIALFNALRGVGHNGWLTKPFDKDTLPGLALALSGPSLFRYLRDVYSINEPLTPDMLIQAIEGRKSGGVEMLGWLIEQGLDVNYMRMPDHPDLDVRGMDVRARSEVEYAYYLRPWSEKKTALHAAASKGNVDAVRFLLERGANPRIKNGIGQTADVIARGGEHNEVAEIVERKLCDLTI